MPPSETTPSPAACLADDCPCPKLDCTMLGNCVECVRMHRTNQAHVPACMAPMFRDLLSALAAKVEMTVA